MSFYSTVALSVYCINVQLNASEHPLLDLIYCIFSSVVNTYGFKNRSQICDTDFSSMYNYTINTVLVSHNYWHDSKYKSDSSGTLLLLYFSVTEFICSSKPFFEIPTTNKAPRLLFCNRGETEKPCHFCKSSIVMNPHFYLYNLQIVKPTEANECRTGFDDCGWIKHICAVFLHFVFKSALQISMRVSELKKKLK